MAVVGSLLALGTARSNAQTTNTNVVVVTTTNMMQSFNIALTGFVQSSSNSTSVESVSVKNKDIMNALENAGVITNSSKNKLIVVTSGDGTVVTFLVQPSTAGAAAIDVSSFFDSALVGTPVVKSKTNSKGVTTGTAYSINDFSFGVSTSTTSTNTNSVTLPLSFTVQGFTTSSLSSGASFNSTVNGTGTFNDNPAVFKGTLSAAVGKPEITTVTNTVTGTNSP